MDKFETLWQYQIEDMKADSIANSIRRSPIRQKLEKTRDLILDRQKQFKQIENDIGSMVDRKDIIIEALDHARVQLDQLKSRFESNPPQTEEDVRGMLSDVSRCRDTIRQYEMEIGRIAKESTANDKLQRSVRSEAASAKKSFDQLKAEYEEESKSAKSELDAQRVKVKEMESAVDPALLEEYNTIKRRISPPVARLTYGQCSGCNTSLPSATLAKIRGGALVECETCGRMIIQ